MFLCAGYVASDVVLLYLVFRPFCEYLGNQPPHAQAVCCIGFYSQIRIFQAQEREIPSTIAHSAYPPPPPQHPALHNASGCRYGNAVCLITLECAINIYPDTQISQNGPGCIRHSWTYGFLLGSTECLISSPFLLRFLCCPHSSIRH